VTPSLASFFWKDRTSAESSLYDTVRGWDLLGIMIAVELSPSEKEFESVVAAIVLWREGREYLQ
jgi:hypothetical protein